MSPLHHVAATCLGKSNIGFYAVWQAVAVRLPVCTVDVTGVTTKPPGTMDWT
jgi:hypothetical protein